MLTNSSKGKPSQANFLFIIIEGLTVAGKGWGGGDGCDFL